MKPALTLLALLIIFSSVACSKHDAPPPVTGDYLIVGWSGGFVPANAKATYYRIKDNQLWLDTNQVMASIPKDVSDFRFNYLQSADKYNKVADLPTKIPAELFGYHGAHIGKPMMDAGYTDVITFVGGHQYRWYFEFDQGGSSPEVQEFVSRLNTDFNR